MKKIFSLAIFVALFLTANSQAIRWSNISTSPGTYEEESYSIAADATGNTYITGSFRDTVYFGSTMLEGSGLLDIFVAKLDPSGGFVWAKAFGGSSNDEGMGISIDNAGNIYITGYFTTKMFFTPTDSLVSSGSTDIFVAKLDNSGNLIYKAREGNTTADYGRAIWAHPTNGTYAIAGDQYANTRLYVAKYTNTGTKSWEKVYLATSAYGTGICMDDAGQVYVSGYFSGNMATPNLVSNGSATDALLIVFSSNGSTHEYKAKYGSTGADYAYGVAVKPDGSRTYLAGRFQTAIDFGNNSFGSPVSLSASGSYAFIASFTGTGGIDWPDWASKGPFGTDTYFSVKTDPWGNAIVTDNTQATVKYMSYGGASAWVSRPVFSNGIGSTNKCSASDSYGNIYTTGSFWGNWTFGGTSYSVGNYNSVYVQKISTVHITSPAAGYESCISSAKGDSLLVSFTPSMDYNPGNIFTLQMDATATGAFASPVTIGTLVSTNGGTIHGYIPAGTADNGYMDFRIISSDPVTTSGDQIYTIYEDKPIATISTDTVYRCPNASSNSITVTQDNPDCGGWGITYAWSPTSHIAPTNAATVGINPTVTTLYTVTVTDIGNGCKENATVLAIVYPPATVNAGNDTLVCRGHGVTLHATGTNINSYNWSPTGTLSGATTATPVATPTAYLTTYYCTVTSPDGCTAWDDVQVTSPSVTTNAGVASINTCLGGAVQLSGTTTGLAYSWSPTDGLTNPLISNPVATPVTTTEYFLTGTDYYGCTSTDSITINVGTISVNVNNATITCSQNATLTASPVGTYVTPVTYSWSPSDHLSATTGASVTANPIVSQVYYVVMTTANGCSGFDSTVVTVNSPDFSLNFTALQQLFVSPPFAVQFTNTTPSMANYDFTWLWGDGTSTASDNVNVFHVYTYNGEYDVTLIAENTTTGCIDTLIQNSFIFCMGGTSCSLTAVVNTPEGTNACSGENILLTCNTGAGFTYQWTLNGTNISGATESTYEASVQGQYSVTIGDGTCNVIAEPVTINFSSPPATPSITKTGSLSFCEGGTVFLSATSGYATYLWSTGATTQNITVTESGIYSVEVASVAGGCTSEATYELNASEMDAPQICVVGVEESSSNNVIVWEAPVSSAIDSFYIYREGTVADAYEKIGAVDYSSFSTFVDAESNPQQQSYKYKLAILDTCGILSLTGDCHKTIHLTINSGMGGTWNLIWNHYEGFSYGTYNIYRGTEPDNLTLLTSIASSSSSYSDLTPPPGLVYYQIEVINPLGCSPAKTWSSSLSNIADNGLEITPEQPGPISGNMIVCAGMTYTFSVDPVTGTTSYTWTLPSGWTGTSLTNEINVTCSATGGTISVTANNSNGSSTAQTMSVSVTDVPSQPNAIIGADEFCVGSIDQDYSVTNDPEATGYIWTLPDGWTGSSVTNIISTIAGGTGGTISVIAENVCGNSPSQTLNVTVFELPIVELDLSAIDTQCIESVSVNLTGGTPSGGTFSGTGVTSDIFNMSISGTGSFEIIYSYTDGNGCINTASDFIFVDICESIESVDISGIKIYPNPATGFIFIEKKAGTQAEIILTEVTGKEILQVKSISEKTALDVSKFSPGVYYIKIKEQNNIHTKKVVLY